MTTATLDSSSADAAPPWFILGAGAIGGLWGLRLAGRGLPVRLLSRDGAPTRTLELRAAPGPAPEQPGGMGSVTRHTFLQAQSGATGPLRQLLVATKSQDTAAALSPLLDDLVPGATVLLLQNGMGAEDTLLLARPDLHLLPAITTDGVFRQTRDALVLAGRGETWLGSLRAEDTDLATTLAATLGMGFAPDIRERRWLKLAMNCAINPLTALRRCRNGELLTEPAALATMRDVCTEVAAVMRAEGVLPQAGGLGQHGDSLAVDADFLFRHACATAAKTAANLSSMRVDADAGRPTEIDFLNGFVAARGRAHGLLTPANDALVAAVQALPRSTAS